MLIDTHAHLNIKDFELDLNNVIDRAHNAGIQKIIIPSDDLESSQRALRIAKNFKNIYAAFGLHPNNVLKEDISKSVFIELAKNEKVAAIGETGLDYYHDKDSSVLQKEVFIKHLQIANSINKPVIIHSREAINDILQILKSEKVQAGGVFHCFSENWEKAQKILDLGYYLSFTGIITFSKDEANLEVIKKMPLDRLLIETDAPYLAPAPHRGERNEPAYVVEVAKKIATLRGISFEEVTVQTTLNAEKLFNI